ncbi:hypothetical protein X975_22289, partial [Stegodyphus mimosarum]
MFKIIKSPATCEVRSVIRFSLARNLPAADIHRQICEVYGATAMSEGKVIKGVRDFNVGCNNIHYESRFGPPPVITDDVVALVEVKILENRCFQINFLNCLSQCCTRLFLKS